jgi:adenylyl-sulfate kinase
MTKEVKNTNGCILWFTGLSGSGKSTIADRLYQKLTKLSYRCQRLDGDIFRKQTTAALEFSQADRIKNIELASAEAVRLANQGNIVLATFISPYRKQRKQLKRQYQNFIEIYVNTPLEICARRDVKGLYRQAKSGQLANFTGISHPYEPPDSPDIELAAGELTIDQCAQKILRYLKDKKII